MEKSKNGTTAYKAVCAVIFIIFSFVYFFYYQTDVLAAAQHVASGGKTHYEAILGPILLILGLKVLQNGIQAIAKLKGIFYALTYFPSFLIMTLITDIPSGPDRQINFGAWTWALPLVLIAWLLLMYMAKQYQLIEIDVRGRGLFSQVNGINITLLTFMILMTCSIGNHNRLFHQRMHVEYLISEKKYAKAEDAVDKINAKDATLEILRAYALAEQRTIGDKLFNKQIFVNSIIPSSNKTYTVIVPMNNLMDMYKRDADWQLCEMLIRKNLRAFYDNISFFYDLGITNNTAADSMASKSVSAKNEKKQNAYTDSLLRVRIEKLPHNYKEALILYVAKVDRTKQKYFDKDLLEGFQKFERMSLEDRKKHYSNTYWYYYYQSK